MSKFFEPYLSFRTKNNSGGINPDGELSPGASLTQFSSITLLIHGYNNTMEQASEAYANFLTLQNDIDPVKANILGVYWPGSNWENAVYYMQAIRKAKDTAPFFAARLLEAARSKGYLRVSIVTHSLGSRFTLETIKEIYRLAGGWPKELVIEKVVFMAGAVPTYALEKENTKKLKLRDELDFIYQAKSLYSGSDSVLHYAFPLGESFGGDGILPTALGRAAWQATTPLSRPFQQQENPQAKHGDYWGNKKHWSRMQVAAKYIRDFLPLGDPPARETDDRVMPGRPIAESRLLQEGREASTRQIRNRRV